MNWPYVALGLAVTLAASIVAHVIDRVVPNYDDPDEMPAWAATWVLGVPISFVVGWIAS